MTQYVYWHAPLWQIALIVTVSLMILLWLIMRAWRDPTLSEALIAVEPALDRQPFFFFSRAQGIVYLNETARQLLHDDRDTEKRKYLDALTDAMIEAVEEGRLVRQSDWPEPDCILLVMPVVGTEADTVTGALAQVFREIPLTVSAPVTATGEETTLQNGNWLRVGPTLRLHCERPLVQIQRKSQPTVEGTKTRWQENSLGYLEERLLRHLLDHQAQVQTPEILFQVVWPDDAVSKLGLRPEQKDRLRRLVYQVRQRVEPDSRNPQYICTAHGVGYVLYGDTEANN